MKEQEPENDKTIAIDIMGTSPNKYIELEKRKRQIVELFTSGLNSEDIIGYHGTSLESVRYLLDKGYLPGSTGGQLEGHHPSGHLYFFPLASKVSDLGMRSYKAYDFITDEKEAVEQASGYASDLAGQHFLVSSLGYNLDDRQVGTLARDLILSDTDNFKKAYSFFVNNGVQKKSLDQLIQKAKQRKGVILALAKNVLSDYSVGIGDPGERDLDLKVGHGLLCENLAGIEPLSQESWDFFEELQEE